MKVLRTSATAVVKIKIQNLGSWGPECTVDQVMKQAEEAARGRVARVFGHDTAIEVVDVNVTTVSTQAAG